jgi:hypothetical protein
MSTEQTAAPVAATAAPVVTPAPKLNAIQLIEQELGNFYKQAEAAAKAAEQAVANSHAVSGAIQATQHLLAKLKAEAVKAEAEAAKLAGEAKAEAAKLVGRVEAEAKKGIALVETEAKKL